MRSVNQSILIKGNFLLISLLPVISNPAGSLQEDLGDSRSVLPFSLLPVVKSYCRTLGIQERGEELHQPTGEVTPAANSNWELHSKTQISVLL